MAYSTRFRIGFSSWDGHTYKVLLQRRGYTGSVIDLTPAASPVTYRLGEQTRSVPILNQSELEIRVQSNQKSKLREVLHPDPKAWRVHLVKDSDVIWRGYIVSEKFSSNPFDADNTISVTAKDGLTLLKDKPYEYIVNNPPEEKTIATHIFDNLDAINARYPLHTLMFWFPYRKSSPIGVPSINDLRLDTRVWEEQDSNDVTLERHEIIKQICIGFGMEAFQGWDGWYFVQPQELVKGNQDIIVWGQNRVITNNDAPTRRNTDNWILQDAGRSGQTRHSEVSSTYDFFPKIDSLLKYPSFEPDDPSASTPTWSEVKDYWTFRSSPLVDDGSNSTSNLESAEASIQARSKLMGGDTTDDAYAVAGRMPGNNSSFGSELARASFDFVGAGYPMSLRLEGEVWQKKNTDIRPPGIDVKVTDTDGTKYGLNIFTFEPTETLPAGPDRRLRLVSTNSPTIPSSWNEGREIVPEGAVLSVRNFGNTYDGTLKLSRPYRYGDDFVYVETSDTITPGANALQIPFFAPNANARYPYFIDAGQQAQVTFETHLPRTSISEIEVILRTGSPHNQTEEFGVAFDNIRPTLRFDGEEIENLTWSAQTGNTGRSIDEPSVRFGDGPQPTSRGAIRFDNGDTTLVDETVSWKIGNWGSSETPSEEKTLAQHRATERLRQRKDGTKERDLQFLFRDGDDWSPNSILEFSDEDGNKVDLWRRSVEWNIQSGQIRVPSYDIYYKDDSGIYTTLSSVQ